MLAWRRLRGLFDLIFPPRCVHCGRVGSGWCHHCTATLQAHPLHVQRAHVNSLHVLSTGTHAGVLQAAVQALKYHGVQPLAQPLGHRLARAARAALKHPPDLITAVPLSPDRLAARGYNQAGLLAQAMAEALNRSAAPELLIRTRHTRPQVGLGREDRLTNVSGAFAVPPQHRHQVKGRTVMVVDDVYTTGATLQACIDALMHAGAARAYGVTLTSA